MSRRPRLPLAMVLLLVSACGMPERAETRVELTLLGLDPSARAVTFTLTASRSGLMSTDRRAIIAPDSRKVVLEHVVVDTGLTLAVEVEVLGGSVIQHGYVSGKTTEAKVAVWTVTLAPITQPIQVCDGLDNNGNGEVDELNCSG